MRNYFPILAEGFDTTEVGGVITLAPDFTAPSESLSSAILVAADPGTASDSVVTFAGTYVVGDQIRVSVTVARSNQKATKSYVYTVLAADTVTTIAAAFAGFISADIANGLSELASATSALGVLTITSSSVDSNNMQTVVYTDSAAGTVGVVNNAATFSEGQPSDLVAKGVPAGDINLASYDTVKIVLKADAAIPFIDSVGKTVKEIYWYGTPGKGAALVTQVNT